jgi:hypothetical protein
MKTTAIRYTSCLFALALAVACAAASNDPTQGSSQHAPQPAAETGGTTGTGGSVNNAMGGAVTTMGGQAPTGTGGSTPTGPILPLPITVTDVFAPSGFMGREGTKKEVDGIKMDAAGCPMRAAGAVGLCYAITYTPQELDSMTGETWAGVFFQNPDGNWGTDQGVRIAPGATKVSFTGWAEHDGQQVEFLVGGVGNLGTPYADTFKVDTVLSLTSQPATYELDLTGATYDAVIGGFGWVLKADSLDPVKFYIDDIQWEM